MSHNMLWSRDITKDMLMNQLVVKIGRLGTPVYETRTATGREHFAC